MLLTAQEIINGGLLRFAPISARFDSMLISPNISIAEVRFVKTVLTSDLYATMITEKQRVGIYNADLGTPQAAFDIAELETLYKDYVAKLSSYATLHIALPFIATQITSSGLMLNNTEFAQNAGLDGAKYLQDVLLQNIDTLQNECKTFLCENKAIYEVHGFDEKQYCNCEDGKVTSRMKKFGMIFYTKKGFNDDERYYN